MTGKTVLVVGSGLSDVYVNLDPRLNPFEFDEAGTPWLDLQFDERDYPYFQQTPVLGGAAVTLEALQQLGCTATLASGEQAPHALYFVSEPKGGLFVATGAAGERLARAQHPCGLGASRPLGRIRQGFSGANSALPGTGQSYPVGGALAA